MHTFFRTHRLPKIITVYVAVILALVLVFDPIVRNFVLFRADFAEAVGGYSAIDVIGQTDADGAAFYTSSIVNNGPGAFGLASPTGITADVSGHRLFVVDSLNSRVLIYNLDGSNHLVDRSADYVLGQQNFKDSSAGLSQSQLTLPAAVAYDSANQYLYVTDRMNHRVMVWDLSGSITNGMDAAYVLGPSDFTTNTNNDVNETGLYYPYGIAYSESSQQLFVVDSSHSRVMVWDTAGGITNGMNAAHVIGQSSFNDTSAGCSINNFFYPRGATLYGDSLFVADQYQQRVMVFDVATISEPEAAVNVIGQSDPNTCLGGGAGAAQLSYPDGVSVDAATGSLFVEDYNNHRVMVFDVSGGITDGMGAAHVLGVSTFASGTGDASPSGIEHPLGGGFAADGQYVVSDTGNNRVMVFDTTSIVDGEDAVDSIGHIDASGAAIFTLDQQNGNTNATGLSGPESVALDTVHHRLFAADAQNNRVLVYNLDGSDALSDRVADYVLGQSDMSGSDSAVTATTLNQPSGIVYDATHDILYVADQENHRVLSYDTSALASGMSASHVFGQPNFTSNVSQLDQVTMNTPRSVAIDEAGNRLFVADGNNDRVLVFDVSSPGDGDTAVNVLGQVDFTSISYGGGLAEMSRPFGATYDSVHNWLYVVDSGNSRILVFDVASISDGMDAIGEIGDGSPGLGANSIDLQYADSHCNIPGTNAQPVYDSINNRLFVPDICNNRVMEWTPEDGMNGESATDVVGQTSFLDGDEGTDASHLSLPMGLAFKASTNTLYVSDTGNNRVMVFTVPPLAPPEFPNEHIAIDELGQVSGDGLPLFDTSDINNGRPNSTGFVSTTSAIVDATRHRLWAADGWRVLGFDLDSSNELIDHTADVVLGAPNFSTNTSGHTASTFGFAVGLALDEAGGRLFVSDDSTPRVLVFDVNGVTNGEDAVAVIGQPDFTASGAAVTQTGLSSPAGLAYDPTGNYLYVADVLPAQRILVFDVASITNGEPAIHVLGQPDFTSGGASFDTPSPTNMYNPYGVAIDVAGGRLFVVDDTHHRVLVFDTSDGITDGEAAVNVLGQTDFTSKVTGLTQSRMYAPYYVAFDASGNRLFVGDQNNQRILVFDVASITNGEAAVNVLGQPDFTSNSMGVGPGLMYYPYGLTYVPSTGRLIAGDLMNYRYLVFDVASITDGEDAVDVIGQVGSGDVVNFSSSGIYNTPNAEGLRGGSENLAIDGVHHRLFVSDYENARVLVFNLNLNNSLVDRTADFVLGQVDFKSILSENSAVGMSRPAGIAYDAVHDRLFVGDTNLNRILVYDTAVITNGEAAVNVLGQDDYSGSAPNKGGAANSIDGLDTPTSLAYDSDLDRLFVSDSSNNRVVAFDVSPGSMTDGEAWTNYLGTNVAGSCPALDATKTCGVSGVSYDPTNSRLFVSDSLRSAVLVYDVAAITDGEAAVHIIGQADFSSSGSATTQNGLSNPQGIAYETSHGYLYVVDSGNNRVMVFDAGPGTISDGMNAIDAYGQTTFTSRDASYTQSTFGSNAMYGIAFDATSETLFVDDAQRVMVFGPTPAPHGGGGGQPQVTPQDIGFFPDRIVINNDDAEVEGYNVLVNIYAHFSEQFSGAIDVLLSNTPDFSTTIPFRYNVPDLSARKNWPKTVAWDLCFGLKKEQCSLGYKTVYARFYVNFPSAVPAFTPILLTPETQ